MRALVTGITGFVGGDVARALAGQGHDVVGLSRDPSKVDLDVPVVAGNAADGSGLDEALEGVDVAYYLIHSLETGNEEGFEARDRRIATNFAEAAARADVRRVVYLGVPDPVDTGNLTPHFRSRQEVESILLDALPGALSLRTWFVVSPRTPVFRFTLGLIDQPTTVLGPWREARTNPADPRDVTAALVAAASAEDLPARKIDVMGPETVTVTEFWRRLAKALGADPEYVTMDELPPDDLVRQLAVNFGVDPDFVAPITQSLNVGDVLPGVDAAEVLGIELHSLDESIELAVREYRDMTDVPEAER